MAKRYLLERQHVSRVGLAAFVLFTAMSAVAVVADLWKLLGISWVAFGAMTGAMLLSIRTAASERPYKLVWGYGLSSGAMITSASLFLVPQAIAHDAEVGGLGIALGLMTGFALHTLSHQLTHTRLPLDHTTTELTAHALAAGSIIGLVYAAMPTFGWLLGLAIVSHKGPAGYAAARRLAQEGMPPSRVLLPACAVGLTALPIGLLEVPGMPLLNALIFGFATGIFLHVAMDFLPRCELGGEIYEVTGLDEADHHLLDQLRIHAVLSTVVGAGLVAGAWFALQA